MASGFPGKRVEPMRAGITAIVFIWESYPAYRRYRIHAAAIIGCALHYAAPIAGRRPTYYHYTAVLGAGEACLMTIPMNHPRFFSNALSEDLFSASLVSRGATMYNHTLFLS